MQMQNARSEINCFDSSIFQRIFNPVVVHPVSQEDELKEDKKEIIC